MAVYGGDLTQLDSLSQRFTQEIDAVNGLQSRIDGLVATIEPLIGRVRLAWTGPAADRLIADLGVRQREVLSLESKVRDVAGRLYNEARRLRIEEAAALASGSEATGPSGGGGSVPQ